MKEKSYFFRFCYNILYYINTIFSRLTKCDYCSSNDRPESYCNECDAGLCTFCTHAHKRQKLTQARIYLTLFYQQSLHIIFKNIFIYFISLDDKN